MTLVYKQIIVAVDGSKESELAFKKAADIPDRNDVTLILINIIFTHSFVAVEAYDRSIVDRAQKFAEELLNDYKVEAEKAGVQNVNIIVEYGSPKTMISRD